MSDEILDHPISAGDATPRHLLSVEKPIIKILVYTDDPHEATANKALFGIGSMIQRIDAHEPAFADLRVDRVSRSSGPKKHADNKIDDVLQKELHDTGQTYDQIWFFGFHQARLEKFSLGANRGGPQSELDEHEFSALKGWMAVGDETKGEVGGGVLMLGDHSNERPQGVIPSQNEKCPPSDTQLDFLGLGRALGRCVPRAGKLRQWDGGPTYRDVDRLSTIADAGFQQDAIPQPLLHRNVNAYGEPDPNGQPHPLFFYKQGRLIDVYPDHEHEGAVSVPDRELDHDEWPVTKNAAGENIQPRPHVIAYGFDSRHGRLLDLVAAYDGDRVNVGRIVAGSTWHHYLNLNLLGFPHPAPQGSASDQIGQFYANLAVWLSPAARRRKMGLAMLWRLATLTLLLEGAGDMLRIGRTAATSLSQVAAPCEINEMIRAIAPEKYKALYFPDGGASYSPVPSKEVLLGCILRSYHREIIKDETAGESFEPRTVEAVIEEGFTESFQEHAALLLQVASEARDLSVTTRRQRRRNIMACPTGFDQWTFELLVDDASNPLRLVFCMKFEQGSVSGEVFDPDAQPPGKLSDLTGTREPIGASGLSLVTLEFVWNEVKIDLAGIIFPRGREQFRGGFVVSDRTEVRTTEAAPAGAEIERKSVVTLPQIAQAPPESGETGTGNGTQT